MIDCANQFFLGLREDKNASEVVREKVPAAIPKLAF
jgi:hypothetical protein